MSEKVVVGGNFRPERHLRLRHPQAAQRSHPCCWSVARLCGSAASGHDERHFAAGCALWKRPAGTPGRPLRFDQCTVLACACLEILPVVVTAVVHPSQPPQTREPSSNMGGCLSRKTAEQVPLLQPGAILGRGNKHAVRVLRRLGQGAWAEW